MKKKNKGGILIVILGFILGYVVRIVAMKYLPNLLPENYESASNLIAMMIQVFISVGIIFAVVRIPHLMQKKGR